MGKLEGLIKWNGKLDNLVAYQLNGQWVVRTKGTVSKHRYAKDPNFQRMRESNKEFGGAAKISAYLRTPWKNWLQADKDGSLHHSLTKLILSCIHQGEGKKGQRTFEWKNNREIFAQIPLTASGNSSRYYKGSITVSITTNEIATSINELNIKSFPEGTTHYQLITQLDQIHDYCFENKNYNPSFSIRNKHVFQSPITPINEQLNWEESHIHETETALYTQITGIVFYQLVNESYYRLKPSPFELTKIHVVE